MTSTTGSSNKPTTAVASRPDHLVLRPMTVEDQGEVAQLFVETFQREPLGAYHGVGLPEGREIAKASVKDQVSFVVEDTSLAGPRRLVAFRTSCLLTAEKLHKKQPQSQDGSESEEGDDVQGILSHMTDLWLNKTTLFKEKPDAKVMKFIALGVDSRYEGLGLAKELLNAAMGKAKELDCDAVVVVASAFATQHLFRNRLGFEEMGQVRYSEWTKGKSGRRPFENLHEPEFLEIFEKRLK
ncbi:hypothetical protein EMPS_03461 [Entomortierella parvispora]|uniref:N-acetyltransferase domain-containing protein n=1 Tax=Entomortierella parvispora TaxID=205924 RepID=A0A9P3LUF6_9FUNG|nr:hypothetical protein EMPS_03461 [Entomortierella parvispora]